MTDFDIKAKILQLVQEEPGIKSITLVTLAVTAFYESLENKAPDWLRDPELDPVSVIDTLVKSGDLVEVEYILPTMSYRVKSLYFPKGTKLKIANPTKE